MKGVTALVNYFGSNRSCAKHAAAALAGCTHITVPFVGGMSELAHFSARTILACDKHRHVINLANVLKDEEQGAKLRKRLARTPFHEDVLSLAQDYCRAVENGGPVSRLEWAEAYFITSWMARAGVSGTKGEFRGGLSVRWDAQGGDSVKRFRSAVAALRDWQRVFARCTFLVADAFDVLAKAKDIAVNGVYVDSPFPGAGGLYKHNAGTGDEERAWHTRLRDALERFENTRVVVRYYRHPLIEELYAGDGWVWHDLAGGKTQANAVAPEVLIVRNGVK